MFFNIKHISLYMFVEKPMTIILYKNAQIAYFSIKLILVTFDKIYNNVAV